MPQFKNKEILERLLKSTLGVISRRTSDSYANVIIGRAVRNLKNKYDFLNFIEIKGTLFLEGVEVIDIDDEINSVELKKIGNAGKDFMQGIVQEMGKEAGFYFIKEIKEELPYEFEKTIKDIGIDLDYIQLEFITNVKQKIKYEVPSADVMKYILNLLFTIMERDLGKDIAYKKLSDTVQRISTKQHPLKYVTINDVRSAQAVELLVINNDINKIEPSVVGMSIQKLITEVNNILNQDGTFPFIERLKENLDSNYSIKLRDIGVDVSVIKLSQDLVLKHVLRSLVDILTDSSSLSYSIMLLSNVIHRFDRQYPFVTNIKIDPSKIGQGIDGIELNYDINSIRGSELGRSIQKIIEEIAIALGDDAGRYFVEKFKKRLGKAYVLRIEEIGVNLHMIELKKNFMW